MNCMKKMIILSLLLILLASAASASDEHPIFTGSPYVIYNNGVHSFENVYISDEFVQYSIRDELGRVGPALALLGPKHFQAEREDMQTITPTGFINTKYDFISGGSLYHRCHMIAHRMTGSGEYYENLFTGTSFLNLGIMSKIESQIAEYISRTKNHVLYKVSPDFIGDELVCRGVQIEARSVEDNGAGVCFNVFCYNVQPYVEINYMTGESRLTE